MAGATNFTEVELAGESEAFQRVVADLRDRFGFDFVAVGMTPFVGAPLRWVYSAGATGQRHRRIELAPGHGIGGIVVKAGKPMLFLDIDKEIDPREYSSYPIVFAEDLRSFCALPLSRTGRTVGVLLCAFRETGEGQRDVYRWLLTYLDGRLLGLDVMSEDFLSFVDVAQGASVPAPYATAIACSDTECLINAQEGERRRISRELHDSIAQELLTVSIALKNLEAHVDAEGRELLAQADGQIDFILDEIHDIAVTLRPSALDHLGLVPALRSQAMLYEQAYGVVVDFDDRLSGGRMGEALETQAYRICQEAILNACKYSGSESVQVTLAESRGWLSISVADHGTGFDVERPEVKGSGCGISGMRERAALIGGELVIESGEEGTSVTVTAPLVPVEEEGR